MRHTPREQNRHLPCAGWVEHPAVFGEIHDAGHGKRTKGPSVGNFNQPECTQRIRVKARAHHVERPGGRGQNALHVGRVGWVIPEFDRDASMRRSDNRISPGVDRESRRYRPVHHVFGVSPTGIVPLAHPIPGRERPLIVARRHHRMHRVPRRRHAFAVLLRYE